MKNKGIVFLIMLAIISLNACNNVEQNEVQSDKIVPFEDYYAGFHVVAESNYTGALTEATQIITNQKDWDMWLEKNFPEIQEIMSNEEHYAVEWEKENLLVHSTYPVSEHETILKLIDEICYTDEGLSIIESEEQIILPADNNMNDMGDGIYYYPYQIVKIGIGNLPEHISGKYEINLEDEADSIEFSNVYMGFHSSRYGDYADGAGEGIVGILTSEEAFDTWWRTNLSEIAVYVLTRAQPSIDWEKEIVLIYYPKQQDEQIVELHPIERLELKESEIIVSESTQVITMPVYEELYEYTYQPYQLIRILKTDISQEMLEKYGI